MKPQRGAQVVDAGFSLDGNKSLSEKKKKTHTVDVKDAYIYIFFSHLPTGETDVRRCIKGWRGEVVHIQADVPYIATAGKRRSEKPRLEFLPAEFLLPPEQHLCR